MDEIEMIVKCRELLDQCFDKERGDGTAEWTDTAHEIQDVILKIDDWLEEKGMYL